MASSRTIRADDTLIQIDFSEDGVDPPKNLLLQWIERAAQAVSVYYGQFPVLRERILVVLVPGRRGIGGGTTWGGVGGFPAFTRIHVGQQTTQQDLDGDWMMTHEMVHTAFPSQQDEHHWMEEGLATYAEPIARVQAGFLTPTKIWTDMVRDMPQGDPRSGDQGLDQTHTWGRTYWGGAQFCLLADINIRKATQNRKGLQDALRAIVYAGGTIDTQWPLTKALQIGDTATGTTVLTDLYNAMRDTPKTVDLTGLWKDLGIEGHEGGEVSFNDAAPFASIRKAITQAPEAAKSPGY